MNIEDFGIEKSDDENSISEKVKDKLGISLSDMKQNISCYTKDFAEKISDGIITLIPYGDYFNVIQDKEGIISFIRDKCSNPDKWKLYCVRKSNDNIFIFRFACTAVEDYVIVGAAFVSQNGKIKHSFSHFVG